MLISATDLVNKHTQLVTQPLKYIPSAGFRGNGISRTFRKQLRKV